MSELRGLSDPTLAFGLNGLSDYSTEMPFIDLMKMSRGFMGHTDKWNGFDNEALRDGGFLDERGWPTGIPDGVSKVGTIWAWGNSDQSGVRESRAGTYVLDYEGEGDLRVSGDVSIISHEDGRIVFEAGGGTLYVNIHETDPAGTGDYIRDISVVREEHVEIHEAGAIFNPDWLDLIEDARQVRFMDWMETNNSTQSEWADRPKVDDVSWSGGAPMEVMVELANQIGADPWFNMPHLATEEYMRNFAEYVRDNLDPGLKATVEYSNEAWNWSFRHTRELLEQAAEAHGTNSSGDANVNAYYARKATEMALIWKDVFGEEAEARLDTALGVQTGNEWILGSLLDAKAWQEADPDGYVRPADVFDVLAATTYFGGRIVSNADMRTQLQAAIEDPDVDAIAWMTEQFLDPGNKASIHHTADTLRAMKAHAEGNGMRLVAYEGGQHVHHSFAISGDAVKFGEVLAEYVRSEDMAHLYDELWDIWKEIGDGPFMQFGDVGASGRYGSWGLRTGLGDTNPRAELLDERNEAEAAWWEDRGGAHFQQGVTHLGTDRAERVEGTAAEDFLAGGDGNDTLRGLGDDDGLHGGVGDDVLDGGAGSDRLVGGDGTDTALFDGRRGDYAVSQRDGATVVLHRSSGDEDVLTDIEILRFADAEVDLTTGRVTELTPAAGPAPAPSPAPESGGEVFDASAMGGSSGVTIGALNYYGATARELRASGVELGRDGQAADAAYFVAARDHENKLLSGETGSTSNYYVFNEHGVDTAEANGALAIGIDAIRGTAHGDLFFGRAHDDVFDGAEGNDLISGEGGDDRITGGAGSDRIDGGDGEDTAVFAGRSDEYDLVRNGTAVTVRHLASGDTDSLKDVETLEFGDGTFDVASGRFTPSDAAGIYVAEGDQGVVIQALNYWAPTARELRADGAEMAQDGAMSSGAYHVGEQGRENQLLPGDGSGSTANYFVANDYGVDTALANGHLAVGVDGIVGTVHGDRFGGRNHDDVFDGGAGDDVIHGGGGNDRLTGGAGFDRIWAGDGDDVILGGDGLDVVDGGTGRDLFVLSGRDRSDVDLIQRDGRTLVYEEDELLADLKAVEELQFDDGFFGLTA